MASQVFDKIVLVIILILFGEMSISSEVHKVYVCVCIDKRIQCRFICISRYTMYLYIVTSLLAALRELAQTYRPFVWLRYEIYLLVPMAVL